MGRRVMLLGGRGGTESVLMCLETGKDEARGSRE